MQVRTIYVQLLDEGVECWRPVDATVIRPGIFRIVSAQADPEERWEFCSGQEVVCEEREFESGERHLVAVHAASSAG